MITRCCVRTVRQVARQSVDGCASVHASNHDAMGRWCANHYLRGKDEGGITKPARLTTTACPRTLKRRLASAVRCPYRVVVRTQHNDIHRCRDYLWGAQSPRRAPRWRVGHRQQPNLPLCTASSARSSVPVSRNKDTRSNLILAAHMGPLLASCSSDGSASQLLLQKPLSSAARYTLPRSKTELRAQDCPR